MAVLLGSPRTSGWWLARSPTAGPSHAEAANGSCTRCPSLEVGQPKTVHVSSVQKSPFWHGHTSVEVRLSAPVRITNKQIRWTYQALLNPKPRQSLSAVKSSCYSLPIFMLKTYLASCLLDKMELYFYIVDLSCPLVSRPLHEKVSVRPSGPIISSRK